MKNIIDVDNLSFSYKNKKIFDKFSLKIKENEWITICGKNGSGKSTLIKILSGLINNDSNITICDYKLNEKNIYEIRKNIGIVFDKIENSFLCETVEDELAFILENLSYSKMKINKTINDLSKKLNITHLLNKESNQLSGGEKCIIALACAIIHNPKILIIDESLSMIDVEEKNNLFNILDSLHKNGMTIINITHDLRESYYSDRLLILNEGEIMLDGKPFDVMQYDKILNRLKIELPVEIDLCIKLKLYGLINEINPNIKELVNIIWQ